jgi:hypothetical protein
MRSTDSNATEFDVDQGSDGRLIAGGWHGYICGYCGSYHIDLLDRNGNAFASMVIEDKDLVEMAHVLMALAAKNALKELRDSGETVDPTIN